MNVVQTLYARIWLGLACVLVFGVTCADAFDIAIYGDVRSGINLITQADTTQREGWRTWCARSRMFSHLSPLFGGTQQHQLDLYREMGVTHVMVYYPFADDYDFLRGVDLGPTMKIMNWSWPGC